MTSLWHTADILLGSNIAPQENIPKAVALLREHGKIEAISRVWETPPVGSNGPDFYNLALRLVTSLPANQLKYQVLRPIEDQLGRVRTHDKYAPRTIDLDLIFYDDLLVEPRLWTEGFLAIPFAELRPDLTNPENGETLSRLAQRLLASGDYISHPEVEWKD